MQRWLIVAAGVVVLGVVIVLLVNRPDDAAAPETTTSTSQPPATTTTAPTTTTQPSTTTPPDTTTSSTTSTAPPTTTTEPIEGVLIEVVWQNDEVVQLDANGESYLGDRVPVPFDDPVLLVVTADISDEVHVHGYDLFAEVTPTEPGILEFIADIPGIFEVEFEVS